jgi:hypothetical protein
MPTKLASRRSGAPTEAVASGPNIGIGAAALVFFGLSVAYFFPAFLPGRHLFGTDYLAGGYFFYDFVSQRLADGVLPKWVPHIYGGLPLLSNPGSTFYPVRLFADFLFPTTWILPFIFVVQFGLAGLGMYLLSRELGCRRWVAFLAGLAFQFTGITISSVYAGHDGRVIVATFAPLLFYFLHRGIRTGRFAPFVGAAATIGFSLLSFQIQNNYYLLIASAIWAVFCLIHLGSIRNRVVLARAVGLGLLAVAFGFALTAVNFLPFLDYVSQSPRGAEGGRGYAYSIGFSMPPAELLSIAVPEQAGILGNYQGQNPFKLHTEYLGAFVLVLLALGFRYSRSSRYWWFFGGLGIFALSIAFGGHTPIYRLYYELLPGTARFRAPSLSFFLFALSLVAMAAITLERLCDAREAVERGPARKAASPNVAGSPGRWLIGIGAAVIVVVVLAAASAGNAPRDSAMVAGYGRFALFTILVCGAIWLWWSNRLKTFGFVVLVGLVTVIDLWVVGRNFFETVPPPDETFAPDDVITFLQNQPEASRVWVLPVPAQAVYRNHGNYLMLFGIDQAGGEHGNQLQRFNEFAGAGEDVYVDWSNFFGNPNFMNAANIRHIISMVELNEPSLTEVHRGSALIYENPSALPRAYLSEEVLVTADSMIGLDILAAPEFDVTRSTVVYGAAAGGFPIGPLEGSAQIVETTPDRVVIRTQASRPALLVLADNYYPGWQATVNGTDARILRANHTFRGVRVDAGASEVVFEFRPRELYLGLYIYLAGLLLLTGYAAWLLWARYGRGQAGVGSVSTS